MSEKKTFPTENEKKFNEFLVEQYLKHGSVDEVLRENQYSLPISYANYQRILDKWGIVKAAGPNSKLTEAVEFFSHLAKDNIPLEELYKKVPSTFKTSATTLYRILAYIKEGLTRRVGCALVVTPFNNPKKILLAQDTSVPRIKLGKPYGAVSLPMGYSRKRDSRRTSIVRVLQQEVFAKQAIKRSFPKEVVPDNPSPFMYLDIADVRVALYHIELPKNLSGLRNFSSFKLRNYKFVKTCEIIKAGPGKAIFRAGVTEAVQGYLRYLKLLDRNLTINPLQHKSLINDELAEVVVEVTE
jgi:hypothetical protein